VGPVNVIEDMLVVAVSHSREGRMPADVPLTYGKPFGAVVAKHFWHFPGSDNVSRQSSFVPGGYLDAPGAQMNKET